MARRFIGVDVGGTKVAAALLEGTSMSEPVVEPTDVSGEEALLDQIAALVKRLGPADAVGVGVPSVIDHAAGAVRHSVNVPLHRVPLRDLLADRLGVPVCIDNDATVAALAEAHDDDLRPVADSLVMFTVGTGVGGGIVLGGRIYRGATGAAGEIGHQLIGADFSRGGPPSTDRFPQPGSLEILASGGALGALATERGFADGRAAVAAARAGDAAAREVIEVVAERLGVGVANAINIFDPEEVVIGGGVSAAGELLLGPVERTARRFVLPGVGTRTVIRLARHGPLAGVRGAALLALQEAPLS